ncbi:MAG: 30S ribosomal protein S25e [Desulfurococcales archaeon ex4484_58]|nr:MAG: 30S ribosomal protein S25e [Desulfurococcales archaeon ex4484_58]
MPKKKREKREEKQQIQLPLEIPSDLFNKLIKDLKRDDFKVLTPYTLAQIYNIKISLAKKLLREAVKHGLLKLYSGGRTPIYIKPGIE